MLFFSMVLPIPFYYSQVASLSKDGQCPDNWKGINGSTCDGEKNSCNSDGDCLDDLKCCHSGCHKQCVKPNQGREAC